MIIGDIKCPMIGVRPPLTEKRGSDELKYLFITSLSDGGAKWTTSGELRDVRWYREGCQCLLGD